MKIHEAIGILKTEGCLDCSYGCYEGGAYDCDNEKCEVRAANRCIIDFFSPKWANETPTEFAPGEYEPWRIVVRGPNGKTAAISYSTVAYAPEEALGALFEEMGAQISRFIFEHLDSFREYL